MNRLITLTLLGIGIASLGMATVAVPEIDPASGINAVALIAGGLMVFRGRLKK